MILPKNVLNIPRSLFEVRLQGMANLLYINENLYNTTSLANGKMGKILIFYRYSLMSNLKYYEEYAGQLLDEIFDKITETNKVISVTDVADIGWALGYLIRNKYVEADPDKVLYDVDKVIINHFLKRQNAGDPGTILYVLPYVFSRIFHTNQAAHNRRKYASLLDQALKDIYEILKDKAKLRDLDIQTLNDVLFAVINFINSGFPTGEINRLFSDNDFFFLIFSRSEFNQNPEYKIFFNLFTKLPTVIYQLNYEKCVSIIDKHVNTDVSYDPSSSLPLIWKYLMYDLYHEEIIEKDYRQLLLDMFHEQHWDNVLDGIHPNSIEYIKILMDSSLLLLCLIRKK